MEFNPNLTPQEILKAGAFGGCYFGLPEVETYNDFNYEELFKKALRDVDPDLYLRKSYSTKTNKFRTKAGLDYQEWKMAGWMHKDDPYGWFEWYLKYDAGRRHEDDARQIKRWNDFCGPRGRWRHRIYARIHETRSWAASPRIQQSLLHWGYEVNTEDYELWRNENAID